MRRALYSHLIFNVFYAFGDLEMVDPVRNLVTNVTHFWNDRSITRGPSLTNARKHQRFAFMVFSFRCYLIMIGKTTTEIIYQIQNIYSHCPFFGGFLSVNTCKLKSSLTDGFSQIFYHPLLATWKFLTHLQNHFRFHIHEIFKYF